MTFLVKEVIFPRDFHNLIPGECSVCHADNLRPLPLTGWMTNLSLSSISAA